MRLLGVLAVYLLIGAGWAAARLRHGPTASRWVDCGLLFVAWPLHGPMLLSRNGLGSELEATLATLVGDGRHPLLPDPEVAARLGERLAQARARQVEFERVLRTPAFSESAARQRHAQLAEAGDAASAEAVLGRIRQIRYMQRVSAEHQRELDRIGELLTRLNVQAEVVRLAGDDGSIQALAAELVARIDGIDLLLSEESDPVDTLDGLSWPTPEPS